MGFTNDVTVAVWLGYDNATGKRRTLGGGATGGGVAVPIFEPIIQAVWTKVASKTALAPPSPEARRQLTCKSVDLESGEIQKGEGKATSECLRVDPKGRVLDTRYRLVSRGDASPRGDKENRTKIRNPIRFPRHLIKYPPATTHGTVGTTTDDILTNPIRGAEHHNQTRSFPALADNSGPVRFGATAIKPLIPAGSDPDAA